MPRVYRHQYSGGRLSKKWYVEYRDHAGKLHREPAYRDKGLSLNHLAEILKREDRIKAGVIDPHEGLPASPIGELVDRWHAYTLGKGTTARHAHIYREQVKRVCAAAKFFDTRSLSGARAQDYLDGLIAAGRSNRTYQAYRSSLLAFGYWLSEKEKLIGTNPFTSIDVRNPELNRKIIRRVLSPKEFTAFLAAALKGKTCHGLNGESRYFLYLVAAYSGLRFGAICGLTPASFNLGKLPSVTSTTTLQKNRKAHTVPLPLDVAAKLRKWFKGKPVDALLWPRLAIHRKRAARFVRFDLKAAGIPYKTSDGQFDFHSLRHHYATSLVRGGANQVEVQHLLDHSSPSLSARYFKHLKTDELRGPVGRLPKL